MQTPAVFSISAKLSRMPKPGEISDFWLRLTSAREAKGLATDQESVAESVNTWQSAVTKWKTGKGLPTLKNAITLATDAGVCVEWLLTERGPKFPGDAQDAEMAQLMGFWHRLTPETRRVVVKNAAFQRTMQNTASDERIREVHNDLPAANERAKHKVADAPKPHK